MGIRSAFVLCIFSCAPVAGAADVYGICEGDGWSLNLSGLQAEFVFPSPTRMDIPSIVDAENGAWPKALTLIGERDTGILVLHDRVCEGGTHEAQMLTQRGQTPILLTGCCRDVRE